MSFSVDQKIELKIQRGIRKREDELVISIQYALDNTKYKKPDKGKRNNRDKLEESQFRNLVRVSDTTESPEVIKNFLRYQVGRDDKWGRGKDSLAERIIADIDQKLQKAATDIVKEAEGGYVKEVHIELIRRYLGYGSRYLKYLNDGQT